MSHTPDQGKKLGVTDLCDGNPQEEPQLKVHRQTSLVLTHCPAFCGVHFSFCIKGSALVEKPPLLPQSDQMLSQMEMLDTGPLLGGQPNL